MKRFILLITRDIFYISLLSLVVFSLLEFFIPKFSTPYLNLNFLLLITVISGIVTL